ncbi:MAG: T9SS type A sorting domain-containing protein [Bacteroidia bacterium]
MNSKSILLFIIMLGSFFTSIAQYSSLGIFDTPVSSAGEESSVGAISAPEDPRDPNNYAISSQYLISGTQCYRDLRVFTGLGALKGESIRYSHDHSGTTKVLFDPNNDRIMYALYQERKTQSLSSARKTYVRRFEYTPNPTGGVGTITRSNRYEVFSHTGIADMVISPNGDLLVGIVTPNRGVQIQAVRYFNAFFKLTSSPWNVTPSGGVYQFNKTLSMDMKGYDFVYGHARGTGVFLKWGRYIPGPGQVQALTVATQLLPNQRLYGSNHSNGGSLGAKQAVGLRPNGEVYYLRGSSVAPPTGAWDLVKVDQQGTTSVLQSSFYYANLVTSNNGNCYLAYKRNGIFEINVYNTYDVLEHTYNVTSPLDGGNALNNLAVIDCKLLACGQINTSSQKHELFKACECDGTVTAECELTGKVLRYETYQTARGPQNVPVYCSLGDVIIDGSGSKCETGYHLSVSRINVTNWALFTPSLFTGWINTTDPAPANIPLANYITGPVTQNAFYHVTFSVSDGNGGFYSCYKLFRLEICEQKPRRLTLREGNNQNQDLSDHVSFSIYPNPTSGKLNISLEGKATEEQATIEVYSLTGQLMQSLQTSDMQLSVDMHNYQAGIFLVRVQTPSGVYTKRVVKE